MTQAVAVPFLAQLGSRRDPCQAGKVLYRLPELLLLLRCGTVAGADDIVELTLWGEARGQPVAIQRAVAFL